MKHRIALLLLTLLPVGVGYGGTIGLYDWAFNVDGTVYSWTDSGVAAYATPPPGYLPTSGAVAFNDSAFDWATGLGTLVLTLSPSPGPAFFVGFFDHEIDNGINGPYNEFVPDPAVLGILGLLAPGQRWEADEPGWVFGDIYTNATGSGNNLDDLDAVTAAFPDNASMALGFNFVVASGYYEVITLSTSTTPPAGGFYLTQQDLDSGGVVHFSASLQSLSNAGPDPSQIPEPSTWAMLAGGIAAAGLIRRRKSPTA
jgi:hypothetical protein